VYFVAGSIAGQVVLGTLAGILLNRRFAARGIVRSLLLIPWVVPSIVAATTWFWMLHSEFGIVNEALTATGVVAQPVGWLTSASTVMPAMIAINIWKLFPFVAVMVLAGLQTVPEELYESARIDGASFWDEVRYIMLPQLKPVLLTVILLLTIWGLNAVTVIYTITRGGPANRTLTTPIQILRQAFEALEVNQAAALSGMYFAVSLIVVVIYVRFVAASDDEVVS
jgi:multiple sugar transport system permease protein